MSNSLRCLPAVGVAVGGDRGGEHDRPLGEDDVAVVDLLAGDPRGQRGDRLEAQDLLGRRRRELRVLVEQSPLVGVGGEQPQAVGELRLGRVDAADEDRAHQVDASPPR